MGDDGEVKLLHLGLDPSDTRSMLAVYHVIALGVALFCVEAFDSSPVVLVAKVLAVSCAALLIVPCAGVTFSSWRYYLHEPGMRDATTSLIRNTWNPFRLSNGMMWSLGTVLVVTDVVFQRHWMAVGVVYLCVACATSFVNAQPPIALFLGVTQVSQSLFARMTNACRPWKCVSLLDMTYERNRFAKRRLNTPDPAFDLQYASRAWGDDWVREIRSLTRYVRLIIVDGHNFTEPLKSELQILREETALFKTLFVVDGAESPVREPIETDGTASDFGARCTTEETAEEFVRYITRDPERMPSRERGIPVLLDDFRRQSSARRLTT